VNDWEVGNGGSWNTGLSAAREDMPRKPAGAGREEVTVFCQKGKNNLSSQAAKRHTHALAWRPHPEFDPVVIGRLSIDSASSQSVSIA
jgi:hypothetical protein